jgi:Kinesin motor domain
VLLKLAECDSKAKIEVQQVPINMQFRRQPQDSAAAGPSAQMSHSMPQHIPYRDSKLTFLLKETLSGGRHCLLIACIHIADISETRSTLAYSSKAKKITLRPVPTAQKLAADDTLKSLQEAFKKMQEELARLKQENEKLKAGKSAQPTVNFKSYLYIFKIL